MVGEVLDSRTEIRVLAAEVKQYFDANLVREGSNQYQNRMQTQMAKELDKVADSEEFEDNNGQVELLGRLIRLSTQESVRNLDDAVRNLNALIDRL